MPKAAKLEGGKAAKPDEKIKREMKEVDDSAQNMAVKYRRPDKAAMHPNDAEGLGRSFPARLTAYDPQDDLQEMKLNAPEDFGYKMLEREDLEWMRRKKQNVQYADFINWAETYFDMRDPAQQRIMEEMVPAYFERREEQIEEVADLQKRIAKLRLIGPRSQDDLFLIYLLQAEKIPLPKGAIWDPDSWYPGEDLTKNFARGMFNPRRYVAAPNKKGTYETRWNWRTMGHDEGDKKVHGKPTNDIYNAAVGKSKNFNHPGIGDAPPGWFNWLGL